MGRCVAAFCVGKDMLNKLQLICASEKQPHIVFLNVLVNICFIGDQCRFISDGADASITSDYCLRLLRIYATGSNRYYFIDVC